MDSPIVTIDHSIKIGTQLQHKKKIADCGLIFLHLQIPVIFLVYSYSVV